MLQGYLETLCTELAIPGNAKDEEKKTFLFSLRSDVQVVLQDLEPGVAMQAKICPCPLKKREDLFIYLMRANLLSQGTGNGRIGLDPGEKFLTLSSGLPYEMNYSRFKENLEDFVNYLLYWREEIAKFENETTLL